MFGVRKMRRRDHHPADGAEHRGEAPAEREQPRGAHAEQPRSVGIERACAHREPELREAEEEPEHGDAGDHDGERADVLLRDVDAADHPRRGRERARKNCSCGDQIQAASPFRITSSAIVAITTVSTLACSSGRMTTRCRPTPKTKAISERCEEGLPEREAVMGDQRPGDVGGEHRHLALREVDHLGRLVDEDERQRERAEDRAVGEPGDQRLEELLHLKYPRYAVRTASFAFSSSAVPATATRAGLEHVRALRRRARSRRSARRRGRRALPSRSGRRRRGRPHA